jgi:hypothetical protein
MPKHALAQGYPYLKDKEWQPATVFIGSKKFEDCMLKYNIEIDRIILNTMREDSSWVPILLNTAFVDSVILNNEIFLLRSDLISDNSKTGNFLHRVNRGYYSLLLSYSINFKDEFTPSTPYGRYSNMVRKLYILSKGLIHAVNSKSAFLDYFAEDKKVIRRFMKKNDIKYKKASISELEALLGYCNELHNK